MIRAVWTIAAREVHSLFRLPVGWIVVALYAFLSGIVFVQTTLIPGAPATMRYFFAAAVWMMVPVAPAISMRLLSPRHPRSQFLPRIMQIGAGGRAITRTGPLPGTGAGCRWSAPATGQPGSGTSSSAVSTPRGPIAEVVLDDGRDFPQSQEFGDWAPELS